MFNSYKNIEPVIKKSSLHENINNSEKTNYLLRPVSEKDF